MKRLTIVMALVGCCLRPSAALAQHATYAPVVAVVPVPVVPSSPGAGSPANTTPSATSDGKPSVVVVNSGPSIDEIKQQTPGLFLGDFHGPAPDEPGEDLLGADGEIGAEERLSRATPTARKDAVTVRCLPAPPQMAKVELRSYGPSSLTPISMRPTMVECISTWSGKMSARERHMSCIAWCRIRIHAVRFFGLSAA